MSIRQSITKAALNTAINYISGDPEKNLPKLLSFIEGLGWNKEQLKVFRQIVGDPESIWHKYLIDL